MSFLDALQKNNSASATTSKSAYQQVFSRPVQHEWRVGDKPTNYGQALATINNIAKTNQAKAMEKLNQLNQYRTQPGNIWYDPFSTATNNAVNELKSYGVNPADLTPDWFKTNTGWQGYLSYNGTTTTPSKPGKKASEQEKAAYALYQYQKSMDVTNAAKNEWAAARDEINYWVNRKDLNLSDDDVIKRVFGSGKYSTLKKMDDTRSTGSPLELNDAIDYNQDSVRGVIWAARNGGGTGNAQQDIANYYLKSGNGWKNDPVISAKMNIDDLGTFSRYEVGMAGDDMDEAGAYFGMSSFDPNWCSNNRSYLSGDDATARKLYQKVAKAEQTTKQAEKELDELTTRFESLLGTFKSAETAQKWLDNQLLSSKYATLAKMDASLESGDIMNMTRAVPYRKQMFEQKIADKFGTAHKTGEDVAERVGQPVSDADKSVARLTDEQLSAAYATISEMLPPETKAYIERTPSVTYESVVDSIMASFTSAAGASFGFANVATEAANNANNDYINTSLSSMAKRLEYEDYQQKKTAVDAEIAMLEQKYGDQLLAAEEIQPTRTINTADGYTINLVLNDKGYYEYDHSNDEMLREYGEEGAYESIQEAVKRIESAMNANLDRIRSAKEKYGEPDDAMMEVIKDYKSKKESSINIDSWLAQNREDYDKLVKDVEDSITRRNAVSAAASRLGGGSAFDIVPGTDISYAQQADIVLDFAKNFVNYQTPEADATGTIDALYRRYLGNSYFDPTEIDNAIKENTAFIDDLKFEMDFLGDSLPDNLRKKMENEIAFREKQNREYDLYKMSQNSDFLSLASKGREWAVANSYDGVRIGGDQKLGFDVMTDLEKDIYFALLGRDGDYAAADQFYHDIEANLVERNNEYIQDRAEYWAEQGAGGRIFSEAMAILLAPAATLGGVAYTATVAAGGDPVSAKWYKYFGNISKTQHAANIKEIENVYGNDAKGQIIKGIYEIAYNRGNSAMNAITFGGLIPEGAGDIVHAFPIAFSAASDALEEANDKGANMLQGLAMFASTFLAESVTEGIEFGHMRDAYYNGMSKEVLKNFFLTYLPKGLSEMTGETINDLSEKLVDKITMGDRSEFDERVEYYKNQGYTPDDAFNMAMQDNVGDLLHTAIISFLSPSADIMAGAAKEVGNYFDYVREARETNAKVMADGSIQPQLKANKMVTVRELRKARMDAAAEATEKAKAEEQAAKEQEEAELNRELKPIETLEKNDSTVLKENPIHPQSPDAYKDAMEEYDLEITILEETRDGDATAVTAGIATAINTGDDNAAKAAATKLDGDMVSAVMIAGKSAGIAPVTLKNALQLAALGGGRCAAIWNAGGDATQMATSLAIAVPIDMQNESVINTARAAIHGSRVAEQIKSLMAGAPGKAITDAQDAIAKAQRDTKDAHKELESAKHGVQEAAAATVADPINDGNQMTGALAAMTAASAKVQNAEKSQQEVEEKNSRIIEEQTAAIKQQAESTVAQQEAEEAEMRAREDADRQEKERIQKMADNFNQLSTDEFIDKFYPDATEEERKKIADIIRYKKYENSADAMIDRRRFVAMLGKKLGRGIRVEDSTEGGKKFYSNAHIDMNTGDIVVDENASLSDIVYFALPHELMHMAENSGSYKQLADYLLKMKYGEGVTYDGLLDKMNNGVRDSNAVEDALATKKRYDDTIGQNHTNEFALQEMVADLMGGVFKSGPNGTVNFELVNRLVQERPNLARRIMNSIKSFLNKLTGYNDPSIDQARRAVEMLNAALRNVNRGKKNQNVAEKPAAAPAAEAQAQPAQETQPQIGPEAKADQQQKQNKRPGAKQLITDAGMTTKRSKVDDSTYTTAVLGPDGVRIGEILERNKGVYLEVPTAENIAALENAGLVRRGETFYFDVPKGETKHSLPEGLSEEYEEARAANDPDWEMSVVAKAAHAAGYTVGAYHGSNVTDITEFATDANKTTKTGWQLLFGSHFTQRLDYANQYAKKAKGSKGTSRLTTKTGRVYNVYLDLGKSLDLRTAKNYNPGTEMYDLYNDLPANIKKKVKPNTYGAYEEEIGLGSGNFVTASTIERALQAMPPADAYEFLRDHGYDSVQYLANYGGGMVNNMFARDPSIIMLDPTKIKSGDPVTYDNDGNPISLEDRFNPESKDIRYSLPEASPVVTDEEGDSIVSELPGGSVVVDNVKYNLASFTEAEQKRVYDALLNKKNPETGENEFTKEEVDQYLANALGIAAKIASDRNRWDYEANPYMKFLKHNDEYIWTVEASTLCAKRLVYQGTFDEVQRRLPNTPLMPEDLIDLANMMRDMGYETPCGICYVESRRRWLDKFAEEYLEKFKGSYVPKLYELTTSKGLEDLHETHLDIWQDFVDKMNRKGSSNPKVVQLRTNYRDGVIANLSEKEKQALRDIGGLRIQSFSDFEIPHILDMMQVVMDMSIANLTSQAYTKVPAFAWIFGGTGIKINLSLIGKDQGYVIDKNGDMRLVFDDVEGINSDEAFRLRDVYDDNVGTILVGMNDNHIIAAMADDRIDFIIPFHKSGWSAEELNRMPVLNSYSDYTAYQNERVILKREKKTLKEWKTKKGYEGGIQKWIEENGEKYAGYQIEETENGARITFDGYVTDSLKNNKLVNYAPVGAEGYWEFDKSAEYNVNKYLKMCAENKRLPKFWKFLVDNGDGSFSLPQGDDKRSQAIRRGYYKTLIDFRMYRNGGDGWNGGEVKGAPQQVVKPNVNMNEARRAMDQYRPGRVQPGLDENGNHKFIPMKDNNDRPAAMEVVEAYVKDKQAREEENKRYAEQRAMNIRSTFGAASMMGTPIMDQTEEAPGEWVEATAKNAMAIDPETGETVNIKNSLPIDEEYTAAAKSGDTAKAQKIIDEVAAAAGYTLKGSHRTDAEFTAFDKSKQSGLNGASLGDAFYINAGSSYYDSPAYGSRKMNLYVNPGKTLDIQHGISKRQAEKIYDKYFAPYHEDRFNTYRPHVLNQLQSPYHLMDYIKEAAENDGTTTDEVFKWLGYNSVKDGPQYAIFDPSQIKSADAVTYDENGHIIPPSQRFKKKNNDIRYSIPADAPYLSDVEHGDMDAAQAELDKVAEAAGFSTEPAYHGTPDFGFTEFDMPRSQNQIFVSFSQYMARSYTVKGNTRDIASAQREAYKNYSPERLVEELKKLSPLSANSVYISPDSFENYYNDLKEKYLSGFNDTEWRAPLESFAGVLSRYGTSSRNIISAIMSKGPYETPYDFAKAIVDYADNTKYEKIDNTALQSIASAFAEQFGDLDTNPLLDGTVFSDFGDSMNAENLFKFRRAMNTEIYKRGIVAAKNDFGEDITYDSLDSVTAMVEALSYQDNNGVYKLYTRPRNQLVVDAQGRRWISIPFTDPDTGKTTNMKTREIAQWAESHGYDSVRINNVYDWGGKSGTERNAHGDIAIFFNQNDVKSADTVTYDDDFNIIPPSERFSDSRDIRYSLPSPEIIAQQYEQYRLSNVSQDKYAAPLEGENPLLTSSTGPAKRQFGDYKAQKSDELDKSALEFLADNSYYFPQTNAEQLKRAVQWIRSNKANKYSDGLYESIEKVTSGEFDYRSADGQARMVALMGMAAKKDDAFAQTALVDAFNRQGTDLGRALQARKLFMLMTPEGRKYTLTKMMNDLSKELGLRGYHNIELKFSDWIYEAAAKATSEGEMRRVQQEAARELAGQIPANWKSRLQAIRMLSMLGNPRTHFRNFIGNAIFVPAVGIKNKLSAVGESIFMKNGEKTKTLSPILSKGIRDFAREDAKKIKDDLTGDSRWNEASMVWREAKPFKGLLQKAIDFNSDMLEKEDWYFLRGHYRRALGGWMQANGYKPSDLRTNRDLLEKGRQYAILEAQKATYRDFNKLAATLNSVSRQGGAAGFIVDAVLPFKKTPSNILRRGIEYSPIGIAKSLWNLGVHMKEYTDYQEGKTSVLPRKAVSPNQVIDQFCAGLTGTAIMGIGALLASLGVVSAGYDDDDDEFEKLEGGQQYSVKLFGTDVTYTMDWAAPACMPFFVGATIYDQLTKERGNIDVAQLVNDFGAIAEPVFNLSMLDGVNSLFDTTKSDDVNTMTQIGGKIISNYVTSYVPSLLGAAARTIDPARRKSFVKSGEGTGLVGTARYAIEQTQNKIPFWSKSNIPYRNAWGEADEKNQFLKFIENVISPGYFTMKKEDPIVNELERLYSSEDVDDNDRSALIPKLPNKIVKGYALEANEYDEVTVQRGQTARNLLTELMDSDYYKNASDHDRASMIADIWTYATQSANRNVLGTKTDAWVLNSNTNPVQGVVNRSKDTIANETKEGWKQEAIDAVRAGDYEALDVCLVRLDELGVSESSVKTAVGNAFKAEYIEAYQRGDIDTMLDIESTLDISGLGFDNVNKKGQNTYDQWIASMDKQVSEEEEW